MHIKTRYDMHTRNIRLWVDIFVDITNVPVVWSILTTFYTCSNNRSFIDQFRDNIHYFIDWKFTRCFGVIQCAVLEVYLALRHVAASKQFIGNILLAVCNLWFTYRKVNLLFAFIFIYFYSYFHRLTTLCIRFGYFYCFCSALTEVYESY